MFYELHEVYNYIFKTPFNLQIKPEKQKWSLNGSSCVPNSNTVSVRRTGVAAQLLAAIVFTVTVTRPWSSVRIFLPVIGDPLYSLNVAEEMREMVGGCCVCSDEQGWNENPLVYCDGQGCTVAVHQGKALVPYH